MSHRYRTTKHGASSIQSALVAGFISVAVLAGVSAFHTDVPQDNQPVHASLVN